MKELGECRAWGHVALGKSLNSLGLRFLSYRMRRPSLVHRDAERAREGNEWASAV